MKNRKRSECTVVESIWVEWRHALSITDEEKIKRRKSGKVGVADLFYKTRKQGLPERMGGLKEKSIVRVRVEV